MTKKNRDRRKLLRTKLRMNKLGYTYTATPFGNHWFKPWDQEPGYYLRLRAQTLNMDWIQPTY